MSETPERTIILRNVRLSFPDLYVPKQFEGAGKFKFSGTFLVEPGSENDKLIHAAIQKAAVDKWGAKAADTLKGLMGQSQKCCYLDGAMKEYDGYAGKWALTAKRDQEAGMPKLIDKDMTELTPISGKPYAGCYVNAKVQIWMQENQWGKGIRCTLITVQFAGDGDAFSGSGPADAEGFEAVEDEAADLV